MRLMSKNRRELQIRSSPQLAKVSCGAIYVKTPLFICYANCCRSVLAHYLYRHLHADDPALSAGQMAIEVVSQH